KWFQKAAEKGDAKAQAALGVLYLSGQGVRQNNATGKIWFRKACDNGYQYACDLYRQSNKGK
ncbi:sel1 repeat family protein, partial [Glaesserella parasuis]|nr:sel1 repeat family protein [Glaesserella parasuis]